MANKVLLKKSSVGARVPVVGDLDYGELALNYADGKLYYKTSSNTIKSFTEDTSVVTLAGTQTLTNKTLTSPTVTGVAVFSAIGGDEGGQFELGLATTNNLLVGSVAIDINQSQLRIFETGGTNRGVYINLASAAAGVGTNLIATAGGGTVTSITAGTGLTGGTITTSGTIAIDSTVTTLTGSQTLTNKTLTFPIIDNIREGYTSTATAAGTTTLTSSSNHYQRFTGSTTQTIVLPVTSTLATGVSYLIENASTGNLTVNSSGGNLVITVIPGVTVQCMCIGTALTTAADWDAEYTEFAAITGTGSAVLSTSPTLVTPVLGTPASGTLTNCTGLPVSGITASTSTAIGVGSIELGHATDTTLARSAAGVVTIEGVEIVTLSRSQTLTNKSLTSPALTGTATFANATSATGFLAVGTASVTTNRIYATNGAAAASILGNNTFQSTAGLAGVSGTTTNAGNGHLGYFNGTVRAGVYGQIGSFDSNVTTYAGYFDGRVAVTGALIVTGDLTVNGTTTTVNSTTLTVDDKNIELGSVASPTDVTADGGGITLKGATDKTFNWISSTASWTSSENIALAAGKNLVIGGSSSGTTTLTATAAASGTLTLPAATDTLVGKATTDTLTNKTIAAGSNTISGLTNANLSGTAGITNTNLANSSITVNGTLISLGASGTVTATATNALTIGTGLSGTSYNGNSAVTIAIDSTVATLTGTQTLTNKTLTSPVISSISNTGTLTLPTSTDTLVGRATTDTLTNKTLSSAVITGTLTAGGSVGTNGYYLQTTGSGVQWAEVITSSVIGYNNSTVSAFPSGDYNGADAYVGHSGAGTDAFGVSILTIFTCMDPVGSLQTTDLGVLT